MGKGLQHPSGRVIALGRLLLASLFLIAVWVDASQPALAPDATFALLEAYLGFAAIITVLTWNNWWLDARLAGPAHGADILMFMLLVLLTQGYTSPFFTFFMFVLLSAAIRWGWLATTLTAVLLTLLYLSAGVLVSASPTAFDLQRIVVRTGHLLILSLILIWFGANRWRGRLYFPDEELLAQPSLDRSQFESGLRAAMSGVRASAGVFVWRDRGRGNLVGLAIRDGEPSEVEAPAQAIAGAMATSPFLYDLALNRGLRRDSKSNLIALAPREILAPEAASRLMLREGLAIPVRSDDGEGELFLEGVAGLSIDHIDIGEQIAADIAAHLQRHALLKAAEERAEARSRLTLARDLHDSVVQFLAGAAFRLEAIKRSETSGRAIEPELDELKQLMLQEQQELRSFITALRSGPLVPFDELASDLRSLAGRLSRQWDVLCEFSSRPAELMIPARLHLDAHQLTREAVANAVRHASAKSVSIALSVVSDELQLEFVNDDTGSRSRAGTLDAPTSLKERVEQAGGSLDMSRGMGVTKVSIALPIGGRWL